MRIGKVHKHISLKRVEENNLTSDRAKDRSVEDELTRICAEPNDLNCIILEETVLRYDDVGRSEGSFCHIVGGKV